MVKRVWGEANGDQIIFERTEQEKFRWSAAVPWDEDGEYVAEMYAEDTAGNTAYICSMLFIISGHEIRGYIVPRGFTVDRENRDYSGLPTINEFFGSVLDRHFGAGAEKKDFEIEVEEGGYCIERIICSRNEH